MSARGGTQLQLGPAVPITEPLGGPLTGVLGFDALSSVALRDTSLGFLLRLSLGVELEVKR